MKHQRQGDRDNGQTYFPKFAASLEDSHEIQNWDTLSKLNLLPKLPKLENYRFQQYTEMRVEENDNF